MLLASTTRGSIAARSAPVEALDTVLGRFRTDRFHAVSRAVKDNAVAALRLPEDKVIVIERGR